MNYAEACNQLGLESTIELTDSDLKKAFKKAALKHHPDKNLQNAQEAKETFQRISTAYEFLNQCVSRGQTGPNQPRFATSDNPLFEGDGNDLFHYYDEDDDDEYHEYYDVQDLLFSMLFAKMSGARSGGGGGGGGGFGFSMGGNAFYARGGGGGGGHRASAPSHHFHHHGGGGGGSSSSNSRSNHQRHSYTEGYPYHDSYDDDNYGNSNNNYYDDDDDDDLEDMFNQYAEQQRRKEEARQAARKREQEHAQYMAERARQAELEGRDFFESWNVKQLMGECTRRGIPTRGKQQKDIIEALISDEAKKRLRTQLKEVAPLLDEWAEIIHLKNKKNHLSEWNGMKVRVIDYYADLGKYLVEWDMNASKKKTKGHTRESKTARIKPENLRLWGTGEIVVGGADASTTSATSSGSDKENNKGGQQPQQEHQQQQGKKKSKNKTKNKTTTTTTTSNNQTSDNGKKSVKAEASKTAPPAVSEVPKTKCCAICYKEHDLASALEKEDISNKKKVKFVVLPCNHIFCKDCSGGSYLPDPTSTVEIRSCRVCHKTDPGVDSLNTLPYIADLQDPPEALLESLYKEYSLIVTCESVEALEKQQEKELQALDLQRAKSLKEQKDAIHNNKANNGKMNKDKKGKLYKQVQASVEAEFGPKRKELLRKHEQLWRSVAKTTTLKELHEKRDAATEDATNAISKHYRRASIKVHPDRHGDKFKAEFDALTKAKNTLSEVELRHSYINQMLQIVCTVGTHWVPSSHKSWVDKHQPDVAEQKPTTKKSDAPGNQAPLQIEGGLMHTKPRKPNVAILNTNDRRVRVILRTPGSSYEFNSYATAVHILGERDVSCEEEFKKTISRDAFISKCEGEIEVDMTLPEPGMWDLCWYYTLEMEPGSFHDSEQSTDATVDLVSPKYKAQLKLMKSFESLAARRTSEIYAALRKLKNPSEDHTDIQNRYETLQEATLKAKHTQFHLEKAMSSVGANMTVADTPFAQLKIALAETRPYKEELDKAMVIHEKKVAYKNFKQAVYSILETGEGSTWMALVTEETLKDEMKGDANRLYQLLMEGKKAYNLELVDAASLCVAAARNDLFSAKQLKALCERSEEVEIRAGEEARRIMIELEKKESAEKQLRSLRQRAAQMDCDRGELVQIFGLKSEPALNGRLAIYLSPSWHGETPRYVLRLDEGREIALRKQNFRKYEGGNINFGPAPIRKKERWSCAACTYLHEGADVERLRKCSMCETPRDQQAKSPAQAQGAVASTAPHSAKLPQVSPEPPRPAPHVATVGSQQKTATGPAKQTASVAAQQGSKMQTETSASAKPSVQKSKASAKKTPGVAQQKAPKKQMPAVSSQHPPQGSTVSLDHATNTTPTPGSPAKKPLSKQVLDQGINLAKYVNTPERLQHQKVNETKKSPQKKSPIASTLAAQQTSPQKSAAAQSKDYEQKSPAPVPVTPPRGAKRCFKGQACPYLKEGKCRYEHSAEEIAAAQMGASTKTASVTPETVAESLSTNNVSASNENGSTRSITMTMFVDSQAAGFVIGAKSHHLQKFSKKSGAKVTARKKSTQDGMCHIQIRGSQDAIDKAVFLVNERIDKFGALPDASTKSANSKSQVTEKGRDVESSPMVGLPISTASSISTVPSVINGATQPRPKQSDTKATSDLLAFLVSNSKALKVPPDAFLEWLQHHDVDTLTDLLDACEDEFFMKDLFSAGLKRFKKVAFLQGLKNVLGQE